jgi:hypothetical protein
MRERQILFSGEMVRAILNGCKTQTRRVLKPQPNPNEHGITHHKHKSYGRSHEERDKIIWYEGSGEREGYRSIAYCPYGSKGSVLWVREAFVIESNFNVDNYPPPFNDGRPVRYHDDPDFGRYWEQCHYRATDPTPDLAYEDTTEPSCRWRSPLFMPRWASRILLDVTGVRVERLNEITHNGCIAEGIKGKIVEPDRLLDSTCMEFAGLWDSINAKPKPVYQRFNGKRYIDHYVSYPWEDVQETREHRGLPWHVHGNPWVWALEFDRNNETTPKTISL